MLTRPSPYLEILAETRAGQSLEIAPSYGPPLPPAFPVALPPEPSFTFDSLGTPMPYSGTPLALDPGVANSFTGRSWIDPALALTEPWDGRSDIGGGEEDVAMSSGPPASGSGGQVGRWT